MSDPGESSWHRLDPRMLLVHPLRELLRFLPVLAGLFVAGSASGGVDVRWQLLGVGVPVLLGLMRYLTTSFRIHEGRVELQRGLVDRHRLSTRLDRVRTVDLTASPIQRVLGLVTVRIGTGTASSSEEDQIDLDGLPVAGARRLRDELLRAARPEAIAAEGGAPGARAAEDRVVLVLDPAWARYAPLTSTGVVLAAGVLGAGSQLVDSIGGVGDWSDLDRLRDLSLLVLVPLVVLGGAATITLLAVAGYLVTNWGFTLTRASTDGAWHLRRGLLTVRETSVDVDRLAGVSVGEPLGLRLAGAARLAAITTGLDRKEQGSSVLVPPAPHAVVAGVAGEVLGSPGPVTAALVTHGPRAVRRRWARAVVPAALVAAGLAAVALSSGWRWLLVPALAALPAAAALAADRSRSLGHALVDGHLVARSGSLYRRREALDVGDVIGWTFRATWFQRRAGLASLVAATAGGRQSVAVPDVPEHEAVAVAIRAVPGLVEQFAAPPGLTTRSGPDGPFPDRV